MKCLVSFLFLAAPLAAGPLLDSWHTDDSARYARIFETYEAEEAQNAVTTWDNGTYAQTIPAYGGVQEIRYNDSNVYVRTTGLAAGHVMGPWYNDTGPGGSEEAFRNWPEAIQTIFKVPAEPVIPTTKTDIPAATIGLMVDGTVIFSSSDTFSYDNNENGTGSGTQTGPGAGGFGRGDGIWNHDAYITEGNTFDKSNAHAAGNQLHYHASPVKIRHLLGDSIDAVEQPSGEVTYQESFNGTHSPILGWLADGLPLYGPYGYSSPMDAESGVRRMISGFIVRDGSNGTYDINTNGRHALPAWAARRLGVGTFVAQDQYDVTINQWGPDVSASAPLPYYMEDYAFKGDLVGFSVYQSGELDEDVHYDLNEQNARFCVTPEFPEGTWAYFTNVDATGQPVFPYNVAAQYHGDPTLSETLNDFPENLTTIFLGGPDSVESAESINDDVGIVVTWSAVEGGSYTVQTSADLDEWTDVATDQVATDDQLSHSDTPETDETTKFYRITRTALATYDNGSNDGGGTGGGTASFTAQFATNPPLPPQDAIESATIGPAGPAATITSYNQTSGEVGLSFDDASLTSGQAYSAYLSFTPPGGTTMTLQSQNTYAP